MDKGIRYIVQRIEKNYYTKNPNLLFSRICCMKEEKLPCNCITGLMVNYAGYIIKNCLHKQKCAAKYTVENNIAYIKVLYEEKDLFPIVMDYEKTKTYYFTQSICMKEDKSDQQAYMGFRQYHSIDEIEKLIEEYGKDNLHQLQTKELYYIEFWIRFLSALRAKNVKESSKAFLTMAIFMFPGKTLKLIKNEITINEDMPWKEQLVNFLCEYLDFLQNIGDPEHGFFFKFSSAFERLTQINVGDFIEKEIKESYALMIEVLESACKSNACELSRQNGGFKTILREIQKSKEDMGLKLANRLNEKIRSLDNMYAGFNLVKSVEI